MRLPRIARWILAPAVASVVLAFFVPQLDLLGLYSGRQADAAMEDQVKKNDKFNEIRKKAEEALQIARDPELEALLDEMKKIEKLAEKSADSPSKKNDAEGSAGGKKRTLAKLSKLENLLKKSLDNQRMKDLRTFLDRNRLASIGSRSDNLGITELDVRRTFARESRVEIFVAVGNGGADAVETTLGLSVDELLVDAVDLTLEPGQVTAHVFDGTPYSGKTVRVAIDRGGSLSDDDQAWARIDTPDPVQVLLVGDTNLYLENVLSVDALVDLRRIDLATFSAMESDGRLMDDPAEVLIFDGDCPSALADRPALYVGCRPDIPALQIATVDGHGASPADAEKESTAEQDAADAVTTSIVDWDRSHPVNRWNSFADLLVAESDPLLVGGRFRSLIDGVHGSLAGTFSWSPPGRAPIDYLFLGFDIKNTNWPWLAASFSFFFTNAMAWLGSSAGHGVEPRFRTGDALIYRSREATDSELRYRDPGGTLRQAVYREGEVVFTGTDTPGVYDVLRGDEVIERFPVSLLSESELRIKPRSELQVGANRVATSAEIPASRDWWKWFAFLALGAVLVEWWVYNRRMAI